MDKIKCNVLLMSVFKGMIHTRYDKIPPDEPLGLAGEFTFEYTYPLSQDATFVHVLDKDTTAMDILILGRSDYEQIYREEEQDAGDPGNIPGMLNRASSNGRHGIWGHVIDDLYFEGINITDNKVSFSMGS